MRFIFSFLIIMLASLTAYTQVNQPAKELNRNIDLSQLPVRVSVSLPDIYGPNGDMRFASRYNGNPAAIQIGSSSIIIKQSGMYKIQGFMFASVYGSNATARPQIILSVHLGDHKYSINEKLPLTLVELDKTNSYIHNQHFNFEVYIPANTTLRVSRIYSGSSFATNSNIITGGWLTAEKLGE